MSTNGISYKINNVLDAAMLDSLLWDIADFQSSDDHDSARMAMEAFNLPTLPTFYVLDERNTLVGPMPEFMAKLVAQTIENDDGAYNVYDHKPAPRESGHSVIQTPDKWMADRCAAYGYEY